jgi:hypothetical protein
VVEAALAALRGGADLHELLREGKGASQHVQRFAAAVQSAPMKTRGEERTREDAVRDIVLFIWRREFKARRADVERRLGGEGGRDDRELRIQNAQLATDIKMLGEWESGRTVIEIALSERGRPA